MRLNVQLSSERLAASAVVCTFVFLVGLVALMAGSSSDNDRAAILLGSTSPSSSGGNSHIKCTTSKTSKSPPDAASFLDGVGYDQLRAAVTARYHASEPETTSLEEQFDDALSAMELVELDGIPIPIEGVDGLYVGSVGTAYNLAGLQQANITHILSLEPAAPCKWPNLFTCLHIATIYDNSEPENNITQYFNQTIPFIRNALHQRNGRILVHCWRGKSRSVSMIMAYLIQDYGWTPDQAWEDIKITRPIADPNDAYWEELEDFYLTTLGTAVDDNDVEDEDDDDNDDDDER